MKPSIAAPSDESRERFDPLFEKAISFLAERGYKVEAMQDWPGVMADFARSQTTIMQASDESRLDPTIQYLIVRHERGDFGKPATYNALIKLLTEAERDTRELCAQQVREILTARLCADFSPEFVNDVAERIRGKGAQQE